MQKIIGRGVLLLKKNNKATTGIKYGFQLSSSGISFLKLGDDNADPVISLKEAVKPDPLSSPTAIIGKGNLILNDLPSSPNDAFYDIIFKAKNIGEANESFTFRVRESDPFGHGLQTHFSSLDLTFRYSNSKGLFINASTAPQGKVKAHFHTGLFGQPQVLDMIPEWKDETLFFTAQGHDPIQVDDIGKLSNVKIELASEYDRWDQIKGLYTFANAEGGIGTFDISSNGAPPFFFGGKKTPGNLKGEWVDKGVKIGVGSNGGNKYLATILEKPATIYEEVKNSLLKSINASQAFSIELWIKSDQIIKDPAQHIFGIGNFNDKGGDISRYYTLEQAGSATGTSGASIQAKFEYKKTKFAAREWGKALQSPLKSLTNEVTHIVFSCDRSGLQRIYMNGLPVAEMQGTKTGMTLFNRPPEDLNMHPRFLLGNFTGSTWEGEIHQMAIFDRALSAAEVNYHYAPIPKISGDFCLSNVIPPLTDEQIPFDLLVTENSAQITASAESENKSFAIKDPLEFKQISLACNKPIPGDWTFSGKFLTRFWDDLIELDTHESSDVDPSRLCLSRPENSPTTGLHVAKYNDTALYIGKDNAWELSFGDKPEYGLIAMFLGKSLPDYEAYPLRKPHLVLADPVRLEGVWLGEKMKFVAEAGALEGSTTVYMKVPDGTPAITAPVHEASGIKMGDDIDIQGKTLEIKLDIALQKEGFFAKLNANFDYKGTPIAIAERQLFEPPISKNVLLRDVLEEIKTQTYDLLKDHYWKSFDLSFATKGKISLNDSGATSTALPKLFDADPANPFANTLFKLSQTASDCTLEILKRDPNLSELKSNMAALLSQPGLSASGVNMLRRRAAERLTLDYDQVLYAYYGWDVENGHIDLQGGMRLRVDLQNYQFVQLSDPSARNGYVGSGTIYIPVNSYATAKGSGYAQKLGFGPFLSGIETTGATEIQEVGVGGLIDLLRPGYRKAFWRLIYPQKLGSGVDPARVVTFVGADSYADLDSPDATRFFFRDKALIIPEIQVYVGDTPLFVPIGTTLRQLAEQYGDVPGAGLSQDLKAYTGKARPLRLIHEDENSTPTHCFINFQNNASSNIHTDLLDLPVIKGDRFYF